jgi:ABC-2 type transport system permease protein
MFNAIYIELYKIFHKKNIYVFLGILLAFAILLVYTLKGERGDSGSYPLFFLKAMYMLIIPIFCTILVGEIFTGEIRSGTLKILLTRPLSRSQLYFSKLCTLFLLISILYVSMLIFSLGAGCIWMGVPKVSSLMPMLQTYFLSIFPMFAFSCLMLVFSLLTRKEGPLIGISLSFMYVSMIVGLAFRKITPYLVTSYFNITEFLIKGTTVETKTVLIGWGVVAGYIVIPILVGQWIFLRKDVTG